MHEPKESRIVEFLKALRAWFEFRPRFISCAAGCGEKFWITDEARYDDQKFCDEYCAHYGAGYFNETCQSCGNLKYSPECDCIPF